MIKILILVTVVLGAGAAGFFGERFFRPVEAAKAMDRLKDEKELLFKMPLGRFTVKLPKGQEVVQLVFDIDVYIMGAVAFQNINGALGRARLRDATVTAMAEMAEREVGLAEVVLADSGKTALAKKVVRKLFVRFPEVRTARVNSFVVKIDKVK
ncbi:flagellar biosynthesis protein FlgH [Sulfitobacter sp. JB4-11]|uniref:flagellar biosynthesis protein FlgH n=1 Tax=Sulfitobacter rhodophyticola TaxID=3238304 RepID=UPI0035143047